MKSQKVREAQASGKFTILFDSGIRTGSDIFRALALGAQGVLRESCGSPVGVREERRRRRWFAEIGCCSWPPVCIWVGDRGPGGRRGGCQEHLGRVRAYAGSCGPQDCCGYPGEGGRGVDQGRVNIRGFTQGAFPSRNLC